MRKTNQAGIDLIKSSEGLQLKPYLCPAKIPTIGYGSTMHPDGRKVSLSDAPITEAEATEYLCYEIDQKAKAVESMVPVTLNDNEFAALVSLVYNIGSGNFYTSTLLRFLNSSAPRIAVADQFLRWNKAKGVVLAGLTIRRAAERALFLTPVAQSTEVLPDVPTDEDIAKKLKDIEDGILKK